MTKSNIERSLVYFLALAMAFIAFGALGWAINRPYKTDAAIAATSFLVGSAGIIAMARWFAVSRLMVFLRWLGYATKAIAAIATLNFLVFSVWGQLPYNPTYSAWIIAVAAVFLATNSLRLHAEKEVLTAEKEKLEARTNAQSVASTV